MINFNDKLKDSLTNITTKGLNKEQTELFNWVIEQFKDKIINIDSEKGSTNVRDGIIYLNRNKIISKFKKRVKELLPLQDVFTQGGSEVVIGKAKEDLEDTINDISKTANKYSEKVKSLIENPSVFTAKELTEILDKQNMNNLFDSK